MKLSTTVMAHKKREALVADLLDRLDGPAEIVWDRGEGRWDTGRRALLAHAPDATSLLVIQDDALPCRDLLAWVERAVKVVPHEPISLFYSRGTNHAHQRTNKLASTTPLPTWLRFEGPWWGVAVVFPTALIPRMLAISERLKGDAYDKQLSNALRRMGIGCHYVLPSLVDHRIDGPSMIPGREQDGRSAWHFLGDRSALEIEPEGLPVKEAFLSGAFRRPSKPIEPPPPPVPSTGSVSIAVMGHRKRKPYIDDLLERLGLDERHVVYDRHNNRWDTGRRALLAFDPSASWHIAIQDDAIPCRDLLPGLEQALQHVPADAPVGLYLGDVRPVYRAMSLRVEHAIKTGSSWVVAGGPYWGVGICLPTSVIPGLVEWCDQRREPGYDTRITHYFSQTQARCWYPIPSLVDHRQGPSLIPGRVPGNRRAMRYIGEESSALDLDWSRMPTEPEGGYVSGRRFFACWRCDRGTVSELQMRQHVARHHKEAAVGLKDA